MSNWIIILQYPTQYNFTYIKEWSYFYYVVNLTGVGAFEYAYLKCKWHKNTFSIIQSKLNCNILMEILFIDELINIY